MAKKKGEVPEELKPHMFGSGPHPNRGRGPTKGSVSIRTALNSLLMKSLPQVQAVARDPKRPTAYRIAANRILIACMEDDPRSDRAFDQVSDRTEGKPHQSTSIDVSASVSPDQLLAEIQRELGKEPTQAEIDEAEA